MFVGIESRLVTTTAEVVEVTMSVTDYLAEFYSKLLRRGVSDTDQNRADSDASALSMLAVAGNFPVGTVVERLGEMVSERTEEDDARR